MRDYKYFLECLRVNDLKDIIRRYMKHVNISYSGKKKNELISHIMEHTKLEKNKIVVNSDSLDILDEEKIRFRRKYDKDNKKIVGGIGSGIARKLNLQDEYDDIIYEDAEFNRQFNRKPTEKKKKLTKDEKKRIGLLNTEIEENKKKLKILYGKLNEHKAKL